MSSAAGTKDVAKSLSTLSYEAISIFNFDLSPQLLRIWLSSPQVSRKAENHRRTMRPIFELPSDLASIHDGLPELQYQSSKPSLLFLWQPPPSSLSPTSLCLPQRWPAMLRHQKWHKPRRLLERSLPLQPHPNLSSLNRALVSTRCPPRPQRQQRYIKSFPHPPLPRRMTTSTRRRKLRLKTSMGRRSKGRGRRSSFRIRQICSRSSR